MTTQLTTLENRWHNAYWFARDLINNDKYGGVGKDSQLLATIASSLRMIRQERAATSEEELLELQKQTLANTLTNRFRRAPAMQGRVTALVTDLNEKIRNNRDMEVFILTCESIMIPINQAISNIPSDDREFAEAIARSYLDVQGEAGLATVIKLWDDLGVKGCLTAERTEVIRAFTTLRLLLAQDIAITDEEKDIVFTGFVQEFERRAGQKRKGRAGGSLEDVTSFILSYYDIQPAQSPEHFQADIEVDNWVRTHDGWLIGISCKRTLRERWKQVTSADGGVLGRYRIKYIFHVITYDEDLSDDKLALLGGLRHIVYLPDNSRRLAYARGHVGLREYVRPLSSFIQDLRTEMGR
jgi:hypothetical protein